MHFQRLLLIYQLKAYAAWLPIVVMAEQWSPDAIKHCNDAGADAFVDCAEKPEKKLALISVKVVVWLFPSHLLEMERYAISFK